MKTSILLLISVVLSLGAAELVLRALGIGQVWVNRGFAEVLVVDHVVPIMTEKHPVRGWANKPGEYNYAAYSPEGEPISVTVLPNGARRTSAEDRAMDPARKNLIFTGGSVTNGFAISDDETFAWKIQEKFPDFEVFNFGVAGYGTFQSLLTLEEVLPDIAGEKIIFYGFIQHHFKRNVLNGDWLRAQLSAGDGRLAPYASINSAGAVKRYPVSYFRPWPLKDNLALVNASESAYISFTTKGRLEQRKEVAEQLLMEMQALANKDGSDFVVVLLNGLSPEGDMAASYMMGNLEIFLRRNNIGFVNCVPDKKTNALRVKGEGHPNGEMNSYYAECISNYMQESVL